jgi:hypothetical protein
LSQTFFSIPVLLSHDWIDSPTRSWGLALSFDVSETGVVNLHGIYSLNLNERAQA